ncbi:MAG: proline dehydrogenase family protein [Acidobacteriota bacterium]
MFRAFFISLSRRKALRRWMESSPLAERLTRRFIAGNTLAEVLPVCSRLNQQGYLVTLDHLGESVTNAAEATQSRDQYLAALAEIEKLALTASISVKLTQLGLDIDPDLCFQNARLLVERAQRMGSHVEFDMESSQYVDPTLAVVTRLHEEFGCVRAVLQAYLFRTAGDLHRLNQLRLPVRLCKGAYLEPSSLAFSEKSAVDTNYLSLSQLLLTEGHSPAIASHDERMITPALAFPPAQFEFQMLYGVRRDLQRRLLAQGFRVRLYVPYGEAWFPYFMRRLAERPANVFFLARNFFRP